MDVGSERCVSSVENVWIPRGKLRYLWVVRARGVALLIDVNVGSERCGQQCRGVGECMRLERKVFAVVICGSEAASRGTLAFGSEADDAF